jgi:hypothetical protein
MKKPAYTFKTTPFKHQLEWFLDKRDAEFEALLDDMGTGKSKSAFDKAGYLYKTNKIQALLLISPKATYINHVEVAIPEHLPDHIPRMTEYWSSPLRVRQKKNLELMMDERRPGLRILSFNTDGIRWNSKGFKLAMDFCKKFKVLTCVDEASDFKSPSGLRSKALLGYRGKPGLKHYSDYRMIMDGTPVTEGPCDFYVPLMFLHEKITGIPSYVAFRAKYEKVYAPFLKRDLSPIIPDHVHLIPQISGRRCHGYLSNNDLINIGIPSDKVAYVRTIVNKTAILTDSKNGNKSFRNLDDLKTRIAPYVTRRLISDCIDMPTLQELTVNYEMTPDQRKLYKTLEEELRVEMANGDLINTEHAMTLRGRLHEILGGFYTTDKFEKKPISGKNPKLELLFETLGHISDQYKIVIWAHFTWEVEMLVAEISKRLGEETVVQYNGPESEAQLRDDPKVRYFVGNQASGSIGLNLQTANYMFFYSRNYKARHEVQAPRRIWRAGQKNNCYIYDLVCNGSVEDEKLFPSLKNKKSVAEEIV